MCKTTIDFSKIDNIKFEGIDNTDYPDYCDAYIVSADVDGVKATSDEIDEMNDDTDFVYEKLMNYLH